MDLTETTARWDKKHLSVGIWCTLYQRFDCKRGPGTWNVHLSIKDTNAKKWPAVTAAHHRCSRKHIFMYLVFMRNCKWRHFRFIICQQPRHERWVVATWLLLCFAHDLVYRQSNFSRKNFSFITGAMWCGLVSRWRPVVCKDTVTFIPDLDIYVPIVWGGSTG